RSIIKLANSVVKKALNEQFLVPEVDSTMGDIDKRQGPGTGFSSNFSFGSGSGAPPSQGKQPVRFPSRINFDSSGAGRRGDGDDYSRALYEQKPRQDLSSSDATREQSDKPERVQGRGFWQLHNGYILTQTR